MFTSEIYRQPDVASQLQRDFNDLAMFGDSNVALAAAKRVRLAEVGRLYKI